MSRPARAGGDEPLAGVGATRGVEHEQLSFNTQLSYGTSAGTFTCSTGPHTSYWVEAGTTNELKYVFCARFQRIIGKSVIKFRTKSLFSFVFPGCGPSPSGKERKKLCMQYQKFLGTQPLEKRISIPSHSLRYKSEIIHGLEFVVQIDPKVVCAVGIPPTRNFWYCQHEETCY